MTQSWTAKYQPKVGKDIVGQAEAVEKARSFLANFKKQPKKALLLYGPSGSGKTSIAHALANELGLELLEVNASDVRNEEQINARLGAAIRQQSLFGRGKLILVDEIDGIAGQQDRGGVAALLNIIADTHFPIVLTSNNPFDQKFDRLRSASFMAELQPLSVADMAKHLRKIASAENIEFDEESLKKLARSTGGDLRAAINDLQSLPRDRKLTDESLEALGERNRVEPVLSALTKIFKTTDADIAVKAFENVDEDLDRCFLWIDENLPKEYTEPKDLARAYEALSMADVFRGRIRRWQHWRFLVYESALLTAGVACAKQEKYRHQVNYSQTTRLLRLWRANMQFQKRKAIAEKIAPMLHASKREVVQHYIPYLKFIFSHSKNMADGIARELKLDSEETSWLKQK